LAGTPCLPFNKFPYSISVTLATTEFFWALLLIIMNSNAGKVNSAPLNFDPFENSVFSKKSLIIIYTVGGIALLLVLIGVCYEINAHINRPRYIEVPPPQPYYQPAPDPLVLKQLADKDKALKDFIAKIETDFDMKNLPELSKLVRDFRKDLENAQFSTKDMYVEHSKCVDDFLAPIAQRLADKFITQINEIEKKLDQEPDNLDFEQDLKHKREHFKLLREWMKLENLIRIKIKLTLREFREIKVSAIKACKEFFSDYLIDYYPRKPNILQKIMDAIPLLIEPDVESADALITFTPNDDSFVKIISKIYVAYINLVKEICSSLIEKYKDDVLDEPKKILERFVKLHETYGAPGTACPLPSIET
jgi:hypothetical protein